MIQWLGFGQIHDIQCDTLCLYFIGLQLIGHFYTEVVPLGMSSGVSIYSQVQVVFVLGSLDNKIQISTFEVTVKQYLETIFRLIFILNRLFGLLLCIMVPAFDSVWLDAIDLNCFTSQQSFQNRLLSDLNVGISWIQVMWTRCTITTV